MFSRTCYFRQGYLGRSEQDWQDSGLVNIKILIKSIKISRSCIILSNLYTPSHCILDALTKKAYDWKFPEWTSEYFWSHQTNYD